MRFSRQKYWSGLPFPSPGDLPDPGIEPGSPALQAESLPTEPSGKGSYIYTCVGNLLCRPGVGWQRVQHSFTAHPSDHSASCSLSAHGPLPHLSVCLHMSRWWLPCQLIGKERACNAGHPGSIPGLGRSPGEGNGNPLQYSCLENPMDRGAWWATVHGVTKSWT